MERAQIRRLLVIFRLEFEAMFEGDSPRLGSGDLSDLADFVFGCASRSIGYEQMLVELAVRWKAQFGEAPALGSSVFAQEYDATRLRLAEFRDSLSD